MMTDFVFKIVMGLMTGVVIWLMISDFRIRKEYRYELKHYDGWRKISRARYESLRRSGHIGGVRRVKL